MRPYDHPPLYFIVFFSRICIILKILTYVITPDNTFIWRKKYIFFSPHQLFTLNNSEPHEIVQFPIDVSKMSEMERTRLLSKRYGKQIKKKYHQRVSDDDEEDDEIADYEDLLA